MSVTDDKQERVGEEGSKKAQHVASEKDIAAPTSEKGEAPDTPDVAEDGTEARPSGPKHGKHGKVDDEVPEYLKRSRRMRKILIAVIVVLVLLVAAGAVLVVMLFDTANNAATQQAQSAVSEVEAIDPDDATKDASTATSKRTTVPDLVALLGLTQEEALERLQHGAQVTGLSEVNEEGNPIKWQVDVALSDEPADSRSGTPSVYLDLNEEGRVLRAGYSVSISSIGYGSISFTDAVSNEGIIEKTVEEAGLTVSDYTAALPEDKMQYSSYAGDGTTLTREYCEFAGTGTAGDAQYAWEADLSYDYTMANATGNLADTIRTIYVYIQA